MKRYIRASYDFYKKYEIKVDGGVLCWSIELQPAPIGNKAMTVQQLTFWYEKLGFKKWVGCMRYEVSK